MKKVKPIAKQLTGLVLALCLLLTSMQAALLVSASDIIMDLPDYPDVRLPDVTLENGLLWYKLDETSGKAQNSIPGDLPRPAIEQYGDWRPNAGVHGGAFQFGGSNYHHIGITRDRDSSDPFLKDTYTEETVAFWFKPERLTGIQMLYAQGDRIGGLAVRLNEGMLQVSVSTSPDSIISDPIVLDDVNVSDSLNKWTHVTVTFGDSLASVYVNGEFKTSKETPYPAMGTTDRSTTIGNNHSRANVWDDGSNTREFKGFMDDLRIYKTVVTPQIAIRAFDTFEDKYVLAGTEQSELNLPDTLTAYLSSEKSITVPVTAWVSEPVYDKNTPNVYTFTPTLELPSNIILGESNATIKVTVLSDPDADPELVAAKPKAENALAEFTANEFTTADDIIDLVTNAINNLDISVSWESEPVITRPDGPKDGSIVGKILLTKDGKSETVDVNIPVYGVDGGLRLRYEFDDGKANDISGNDRHGATYGTLKDADGIHGKAMYFSGGYVHMPSDVIQDLTNFSISVWINPLSDFQYARVWDIGSGETNFLNLWLRDDTQRKYSTNFRINETSTTRVTAEQATFKTGTWVNLTVTYDESDNGRLTLYQDGRVLVSSQTNRKLSTLGPATNAILGWSQMKNDYDYHGYMDDFRIYDRTLTPEEINKIVDEGIESLLNKTAEKLDIAEFNGFKHLTGVVQNLSLPKASDILYSGAEITWESSNTSVISDSGKIADVTTDSTATLTATLTRGGKTVTKEFQVTVKADRTINPDPVPDVITVPGLYPDLPSRISANNGQASVKVTWETPDPKQYAGAGEFTLEGTADGKKVTVKVKVDGTLFTNPIIGPASPDPFFYYKDGYYYYVRSSYSGLTVSKAKRIQDIGQVPRVVVFSNATAPDEIRRNWWAPEIHFLDGNWYIYWAANDGRSENHRMYVLESTDPNDAQASYELKGRLAPTKYNETTDEWEVDPAQDMWAIDGTVFENKDGRRYFLWSGYDGSPGNFQKIFIAEMLNPWTLKGSRTLIAEPLLPFEIRGGGYRLTEGPQVITKGNKIHVLYSACQANYDWYCLNILTADADSDLLDSASWTKHPGPVFTKSNNSADESFATGHAMVVQSPDGTEHWLIYHAYTEGNATNHMGDMEGRCTRAVKISWDGDMPVFGNPAPFSEMIKQPSGTPDAVALKYEAETAELAGNARVTTVNRASGRKIVTNITQNASVTFEVDVPVAGRYLISFIGNSRSSSGHTGYQKVTINGVDYKIQIMGNNANVINKFIPSNWADADQLGKGLYVDLPKGESTITVTYHPDANAVCDLDYLYLLLDEDYSISLDKSTLSLENDETETLVATITPTGSIVKWSSSNENVATVDQNGRVTAISSGTAIITAELPDGSKAECTVIVSVAGELQLGDVNGDGQITVVDVVTLRAGIMGRQELTEEQLRAANVDGDPENRLTVADVVALRRLIMGLD